MEAKDIIILGIESSCDDTSAAVIRNGVLLSSVIASQAVHEAYGGVVPELASRAHQQNIVPVVHEALKRAGVTKEQLSAVAFTRGPGLMHLQQRQRPCYTILCHPNWQTVQNQDNAPNAQTRHRPMDAIDILLL